MGRPAQRVTAASIDEGAGVYAGNTRALTTPGHLLNGAGTWDCPGATLPGRDTARPPSRRPPTREPLAGGHHPYRRNAVVPVSAARAPYVIEISDIGRDGESLASEIIAFEGGGRPPRRNLHRRDAVVPTLVLRIQEPCAGATQIIQVGEVVVERVRLTPVIGMLVHGDTGCRAWLRGAVTRHLKAQRQNYGPPSCRLLPTSHATTPETSGAFCITANSAGPPAACQRLWPQKPRCAKRRWPGAAVASQHRVPPLNPRRSAHTARSASVNLAMPETAPAVRRGSRCFDVREFRAGHQGPAHAPAVRRGSRCFDGDTNTELVRRHVHRTRIMTEPQSLVLKGPVGTGHGRGVGGVR